MEANRIIDELMDMGRSDKAAAIEMLKKAEAAEFDFSAITASCLTIENMDVGTVILEMATSGVGIEEIKGTLAIRIRKLQALDAML
jgi:hypothetical protein